MVVLILLSYCLVVECLDQPTCTDLKNFPQIIQDKKQPLAILNVSSETGFLGCVQRCVRVKGCESVSLDVNSGTCYQHDQKGSTNHLQAQPGFLFTAVKDWSRMSDLMTPSPDVTNKETGNIESKTTATKTIERKSATVDREMRYIARYLTWYASNTLARFTSHASRNILYITFHMNKFKQITPFSDHFNSLYVKMANATAWSTAHEKLGDKAKSDNLSKLVKDLYKQILKTGEVTVDLAQYLQTFCWLTGREVLLRHNL